MNIFGKIYARSFQAVMRLGMMFVRFREPANVSFGGLCGLLKENSIKRILLIATKRAADNSLYAGFLNGLGDSGIAYTLFDTVPPDPESSLVNKVAELYRANGCDGIVAIGGGSVIDCAKAVGAVIATGKEPAKLHGVLKVGKRLPFFAVVPTTAGTGSEVSPAAVITDTGTGRKASITDPNLIPGAIVLEPSLTLSVPPLLTATTGMDALTHAVEAYINNSGITKADARSKIHALFAVSSIIENLPKAFGSGGDIAVRENMLLASNLAGKAFSRAYVGYVHAIGHAIGAKYHIAHGKTMAVILPIVLEAYGKSARKKLARLAISAGLADIGNIESKAAAAFIDKIKEMNKIFGLPDCFDCIETDDIPKLAEAAAKEANPFYPVPKIFGKKELAGIILKISGKH